MKLDSTDKAKARKFAAARPAAGKINLGPDNGWQVRWLPRLAGKYVRNKSDPEKGFVLRESAIDAARQYRDSCVRALSEV